MSKKILTKVVAAGRWGTVEAVVLESGKCPFVDFTDELDRLAVARFMNLFQQMADNGIVSQKRFKKEMGALSAFRHEVQNLQIRFPCFRDGNCWILTHGFIKPGAKKKLGQWPPTEVDRATRIMNEYLARKPEADQKNALES